MATFIENFSAATKKVGLLIGTGIDLALAKAKSAVGTELSSRVFTRKAIVTDVDFSGSSSLYLEKGSFVSFDVLRQLSEKDMIVAAVISKLTNRIAAFAQPQKDKYTLGFRIVPNVEADGSKDEVRVDENDTQQKTDIANLVKFLLNTGIDDPSHRPRADRYDFETFLRLIVRDRLVYNQIGIECIPTKDRKSIAYFLPVSGGSLRFVHPKAVNEASNVKGYLYDSSTGSNDDPTQKRRVAANEATEADEVMYAQVHRGQIYSVFTDEELIYRQGIPSVDLAHNGYCYAPGAKVLLVDGSTKNIEDVRKGDKVITHTGQTKSVLWDNNRSYKDKLYLIKPYGMETQEVTDEHPILIVSEGSRPGKYVRFAKQKNPIWVKARDIKKGDYACVPKLHYSEKEVRINVARLISNPVVIGGYVFSKHSPLLFKDETRKKSTIPYNLDVDKEWAWIFGLYLGDGCVVGGKSIRFDLGSEEYWIIERLVAFCDRYNLSYRIGPSYGIDKSKKMQSVWIYNSVFAGIIQEFCAGACKTKRVDPRFLSASRSIRMALLEGWIDADGKHMQGTKSRCSEISAVSASPDLAYGMSMIMNTLGYLAKVQKYTSITGFAKHKPSTCYNVSFPSIWNKLGFDKIKNKKVKDAVNTMYIEDDNYFYVKITSIKTVDYDGLVYNIEVEDDHSFMANGIATHNSPGELELLINTVANHRIAELHTERFFRFGYGSNGILNIKADISDEDLQAIKRQFQRQYQGVRNSYKMPIIATKDGVEFITTSASNRDMEWGFWIEYLIKIITGVYGISPSEINFDISRGSGPTLSDSGKHNEVVLRDTRNSLLRPLLRWIESIINNEIMPRYSKDLARKYDFEFVGLDFEDQDVELGRIEKRVRTYVTVNEIREEEGKKSLGELGDIILDSVFLQNKSNIEQAARDAAAEGNDPLNSAAGAGSPDAIVDELFGDDNVESAPPAEDSPDAIIGELFGNDNSVNADSAQKSVDATLKKVARQVKKDLTKSGPKLVKVEYWSNGERENSFN